MEWSPNGLGTDRPDIFVNKFKLKSWSKIIRMVWTHFRGAHDKFPDFFRMGI